MFRRRAAISAREEHRVKDRNSNGTGDVAGKSKGGKPAGSGGEATRGDEPRRVAGSLRLGDLLVARGVLEEAQRDEILAEQSLSGRPFGALAERMFGVSPRDIEQAWAEQYSSLAPTADLDAEEPEPYALSLIERRQAWQFRVLPLRFDGDELLVCTTRENLPRALRFTGWSIGHRCVFVITSAEQLDAALERHYSMGGSMGGSMSGVVLRAKVG
jgi:hypothetical protein